MFHLILHYILDNVGGRLVLPDKCSLPARCAVCNKPTDGPARRMRFSCSAVMSESAHYTVYLHLCRWHAGRRKLLLLVSASIFLGCLPVALTTRQGREASGFEIAAFAGMIASGLIFINLLLHDPFFRGLELVRGGMAIKGFGRRFRESLQPDEIVVGEPSDANAG